MLFDVHRFLIKCSEINMKDYNVLSHSESYENRFNNAQFLSLEGQVLLTNTCYIIEGQKYVGNSDKNVPTKKYPIAIFNFLYKLKEGKSISSSGVV